MMMRILCALGLLFAIYSSIFASPIFDNGKTKWKIYVAKNPDNMESFAAKELASFLTKASGCDFKIVRGGKIPLDNAIVLGSVQTMPEIKAKAQELKLNSGNEQKIAIYTIGNNLYLAGRSQRGTINSVYEFLYGQLGIRWFWPEAGGEFVPKKKIFKLNKLAINKEPSIIYRGCHYLNGTNLKLETFLARNHGNIIRHGTQGGAKRIHERNTLGFYFYYSGHNIDPKNKTLNLKMPDALKKYPKWFAEINGKRTGSHFCWNNKNFEDHAVKSFINLIKKTPQIDILGFYPSDTKRYCQCSVCSKVDVSTNWFNFLRRITNRIKDVYPKMRFASIAYQGYRPFPKCDMKGYEFIEYTLYGRCYVHSFNSACPVNKKELTTWGKWINSGIATGIYGYEFAMFNRKPPVMLPIYSMLSEQMRFFKKKKVIAVLPEIQGEREKEYLKQKYHVRRINRLGFYLYIRLMWEPEADVNLLIKDFCNYVYPSASDEMFKYFSFLDKRWKNMSLDLTVYGTDPLYATETFIDAESVKHVFKIFAIAKAKMQKNNSTRELKELAFEQSLFKTWSELLLQCSDSILNVSTQEAVNKKLSKTSTLSAVWSSNSIVIGISSKAIKAEVELCKPDGTSKKFKNKFLNGKVKFVLKDKLMQTNTRLLKVTLSATGIKSEKHDIVLYCGKYKSVAKRILISVPDNKTAKISVPKLRKDLFNLGWQTRILKEAKKMFSTNLKDFHLVFISLKANKLPKSLWDKKLFPYVKNGGTLIVGAAGQFDFAKIFGNADYRLQWTGPQDYVATSYLKPGKWLNTPNPFGWETKQYNPPKSGFKVPAKSKWESLAIMRKKDGSTASYILEFKKGKGRIILTSGTLGIDRDGFMCRIALGSSRNNKTVKYLFNNLHRNQ